MKKYALLFLLLIAFTGIMSAQTPVLDHFRCYLVPTAPTLAVSVRLQDQFDSPTGLFENITSLVAVRFCNPDRKVVNGVVTPIVNPAHHLTMYVINQQPVVSRTAVISNQFGTQNLVLADARFLLVPTGKGVPPNPAPSPSTDLDHYKCYAASGANLNRGNVALSDQFIAETITVLQPVLFCNPVLKIHGNVTTPILHPSAHLTCYATSASHFTGVTVNTRNQFSVAALAVRQPDLLCVPSTKLSWAVTAPAGSGI